MSLRFHTLTDASSRNWLGALTGMLLVEHTECTCKMVPVYSNVAKARAFGRSKGRAQYPLPCGWMVRYTKPSSMKIFTPSETVIAVHTKRLFCAHSLFRASRPFLGASVRFFQGSPFPSSEDWSRICNPALCTSMALVMNVYTRWNYEHSSTRGNCIQLFPAWGIPLEMVLQVQSLS